MREVMVHVWRHTCICIYICTYIHAPTQDSDISKSPPEIFTHCIYLKMTWEDAFSSNSRKQSYGMLLWRGLLIGWPDWGSGPGGARDPCKILLISFFIHVDDIRWWSEQHHTVAVRQLAQFALCRKLIGSTPAVGYSLLSWPVCSISVFVWSTFFSFLPPSKNVHKRLIGDCKLPLGVCKRLCIVWGVFLLHPVAAGLDSSCLKRDPARLADFEWVWFYTEPVLMAASVVWTLEMSTAVETSLFIFLMLFRDKTSVADAAAPSGHFCSMFSVCCGADGALGWQSFAHTLKALNSSWLPFFQSGQGMERF